VSGVESVTGNIILNSVSAIKGAYSAVVPNASNSYLQQGFVGVDKLYVSFYLKLNSLPASDQRILLISDAGTSVGNILLRTNGALRLRNASNTIGLDTAPLQTGTVYRVGIRQESGTGGNAVLEGYWAAGDSPFQSPFAATATGTWTTRADRVRFGATISSALDATFDNIMLDSGSMPGASAAPQLLSNLRVTNTIMPSTLGFTR
jgi:hypothetical protein